MAYLTGEYPQVTDTYIRREVAALRRLGAHVQTFSVRRPVPRERTADDRDGDTGRTIYLVPSRFGFLVRAHAALLLRSPRRYLSGLSLALRLRAAGLRSLIWQLFYFAEAGMLAERMRELGLQHLHNHRADSSASVATLAAHLGAFRFSFTIHGPAIFFEPRRWHLDEKVRRASFVACISHFCRSQTMLWVPESGWSKLKVVHCGIEPGRHAMSQHGFGTHRLVFVGRLARQKGLPLLFEALATLKQRWPAITLDLVADGPERNELEAMVQRRGLDSNVRFHGYCSEDEVRSRLCQSDVFVLPSLAEGVPVVLMEAMAAGLPVVAPAIAGIPELVEHGISGYLTNPGDVDDLTDAITRLLADRTLRERMGAAGRARVVKDFDADQQASRLYSLIAASSGA